MGSGGPGETHPNEGVGSRQMRAAGTQQGPAGQLLKLRFCSPRALCPFQLPALWSNLASALALGPCRVPCPSGFYLQQLDPAIQTPAIGDCAQPGLAIAPGEGKEAPPP